MLVKCWKSYYILLLLPETRWKIEQVQVEKKSVLGQPVSLSRHHTDQAQASTAGHRKNTCIELTMCYTLFWVINMFITCLIFKTTLGILSILLIRKLRHRHLVVCPKVPWVIDDGAKFLPVILLCSKNTELRERSPGFLVLALLLVTAMTPKT